MSNIDWESLWSQFDEWYAEDEQVSWEKQTKKIESLVEQFSS